MEMICKFTVVVPIYNKAKYVVRCLESLREQSLTEFEIICIDDGSTDSSNQLVRECMVKDERIILLENEENRGVSYSRNCAISNARGEYIFFLDADDYLHPQTLEQYYNEINAVDADMLFFNFVIQKESMYRQSCDEGIRGIYPRIYNGQELLEEFARNNEFFLYACMVAYKKKFVWQNKLRFDSLICGEGGDFILSALCLAEKVIVSQYKGYVYCLNDDSVNTATDIVTEALYGQVVQYVHMMQKASESSHPEHICTFLDWYKIKIKAATLNLSDKMASSIKLRLPNDYFRHVWSLLSDIGEDTGEVLFSDEDMEVLKKEKAVLIYGAGREIFETLNLLNRLRIELQGIVVTQKIGNPEVLFGHRVHEIKELMQFNSHTLVLITAHSQHQSVIAAELETRGFHRYISVKRR